MEASAQVERYEKKAQREERPSLSISCPISAEGCNMTAVCIRVITPVLHIDAVHAIRPRISFLFNRTAMFSGKHRSLSRSGQTGTRNVNGKHVKLTVSSKTRVPVLAQLSPRRSRSGFVSTPDIRPLTQVRRESRSHLTSSHTICDVTGVFPGAGAAAVSITMTLVSGRLQSSGGVGGVLSINK